MEREKSNLVKKEKFDINEKVILFSFLIYTYWHQKAEVNVNEP